MANLQVSEQEIPKKEKKKRERKPNNRIWELDFLRGFSIVLMCIDHLFFNVASMYPGWEYSDSAFLRSFYHAASRYLGESVDKVLVAENLMQLCEYVFFWMIIVVVSISFIIKLVKHKNEIDRQDYINYAIGMGICVFGLVFMVIINNTVGYGYLNGANGHSLRDFVHTVVLWFFFLLCGMSCRFSKNNFKRTLQIAICAGLISLFTYLAELILDFSGLLVSFGVLHMLASVVLIYSLIELACKLIFKNEQQRKYAISIVCLVVAIVFYAVNQYLWAQAGMVKRTNALAWFHYVYSNNFKSSDYFTVCESIYKVMFGAALAPFIYPKKESIFPKLQIANKGFFTFMGRHTLIVVLAHQLIISGILYLIDLI